MQPVKRMILVFWGLWAMSACAFAQVSEDFQAAFTEARALVWTEPDQALAQLKVITETYDLPKAGRWYAEVEFAFGLAYYQKDFYELAKERFNAVLATQYGQTSDEMKINIYNNLGVVNDLTRNYSQALESYQKALEIEQRRDRPVEMAEIYSNISLIYYNLSQPQDGLDALDRAWDLVKDEPEMGLIHGLIYQNRAINHYDLAEFDEFRAANESAIEIYDAIGQYPRRLQITYNLIRDAIRRTQDVSLAETLLARGEQLAKVHQVRIMEPYFLLQRGELALLQDQAAAAREYFDQSQKAFAELGIEGQSLPDDLYQGLMAAHARLGEADAVMETLAEFRQAIVDREMATQRASVNQLKTQLEFNEQANELQQKTIELQGQQARAQRLAFVTILLLILLLAGLAYHLLRLRTVATLYELNQRSLRQYQEQRDQKSSVESAPEPSGDPEDAPSPRGQRWVFNLVEEAMKKEKVYQQTGLTLPELAERLNVPKRNVSESINAYAGVSFPEYLNQYRIIHAMERFDDHAYDHVSIDQILDEVGFQSRSAFYTAFKKSCGMTPKEYRKVARRQSA